MTFDDFSFAPSVRAGVDAAGYQVPTPIQEKALPLVIEGRDVMGLAQTGTGKTAAFALPILNRIVSDKKDRRFVRALVVAPTRELAEQINDSFKSLGKETGVRTATVYGGVKINPQISKLRDGIDVVVACPGRLLDHINQGTINLSRLEFLVLDEADQMFDMGFLPDIRRIIKQLPHDRQTLMFSATMPEDIKRLSGEALRNPEVVQIGRVSAAQTVAHALYPVQNHLKTALLLEILRHTDTGSVLVFTKTKHRAKRVGELIEKAGYKAASLQGNLSQNRRQAALDGFKDGTFQILVATDIAARGIDVSGVSHVINYDIPDTTDAYIHRIGRTGRAAQTGDAFTLVDREDEYTIRQIERAVGKPIERRTMESFDYSAPAPARDTEFSRPPMPPRGPGRGRASGGSGQGNGAGYGGGQGNQRAVPQPNRRSANASGSDKRAFQTAPMSSPRPQSGRFPRGGADKA